MFAAAMLVAAGAAALPPAGTHAVSSGHFNMPLPAGTSTTRVGVHYPADLDNGPYPLVSFAHGMLAGGVTGRLVYTALIKEVVSMGAIVVAPESCLLGYCDAFYLDQLAVIGATHNTSNHPAFRHIDHSNVGVAGHSMGGQATEQSASSVGYNIKAAAPMHAVSSADWVKNVTVPMFYSTGTLDAQAPSKKVREAYEATPSKGTIYANLKGANHYEPCNLGQGRLDRFAAYFFNCHLTSNKDSCQYISTDYLCAQYDFKECVSK
eukprot:Hpha_TRINITY_DN12890_c0_g1::TRINITY_DN12890_c0_g1_i1::g.24371::m.24371